MKDIRLVGVPVHPYYKKHRKIDSPCASCNFHICRCKERDWISDIWNWHLDKSDVSQYNKTESVAQRHIDEQMSRLK